MTPEAGFDSAEPLAGDEALSDASVDATLDTLFRSLPAPHVMACGANGLTVPMPSAVPVLAGNVVTGVASPLELCVAAELPSMVAAWGRVRQTRGAQVVVHLRSNPERTVTAYFLDARHRYGVFLDFFVGNMSATNGGSAAPSLFRPRMCTIQRDELGVIRGIDAAATKILGWANAELIGTSSLDLVHPDDRSQAIVNWVEMLGRPNADQRGLLRFRHRDGSYIWFESTNHNLLGDPAIRLAVTDLVDVSDRMKAMEALRANEQLLRRLTEALPVGILQIDAERRIIHANERLGEIVGVSSATTVAEQFSLVTTADRKIFDVALDALIAHGTPVEIELTVDHPTGARRCGVSMRALTTDNGAVTGAIACVTDVTERVRMREELVRRATFDTLTCCRNRAAILETLARVLHVGNRPHTGIAVLFVDLDRFKAINDRWGHAAGDELLRCVGDRLLHGARAGDIVGRLGGDEFLIVCPDVATPQSALDIARRIAMLLAQQTVVGSESIMPYSSIGVAWTDLALDADTLVARADAAMYEAKRLAAGPVLYQPSKLVAGGVSPR